MKTYRRAALLLALAVSPASAQEPVPVRVGGSAGLDACSGLGQVYGLDPAGDNFLAVRSGPGARHAETDRLGPARAVAVCDENGSWLGIVYGPSDGSIDCGVASPAARRQPYRGPCRSGWVHRRFVDMVAG